MTDEWTTDGTAEISQQMRVTVAVGRFRKRFPAEADAIGQRMRLLLHLLDRVAEHANRHGVAAVFAGQAAMDAFAFDRWYDHKEQHPGGQQNQAVQESLPRLVNYWKRELESGGSGRDGSTFARNAHHRVETVPGGFVLVEDVPDPFAKGKLLCVRFRVRQTKDRLAALAIGEPEEQEKAKPKPDPRLVLPPRSAVRQLHENAQALVTAFKESERSEFRYTDRGTHVAVAPAPPAATKGRARKVAEGTAVAAVALVALMGVGRCAATGYSRAVASGVQRFTLINKIGASAICDPSTGSVKVIVDWAPAVMPESMFTNAHLLRNGRVIATVDGRVQFLDESVKRGSRYRYTLELADVFGNVLARDEASGGADATCPDDPTAPMEVEVLPRAGTFDTTFRATVRPPADEGTPVSYGWQLKAERSRAAGGLQTPPLSITQEPTRLLRFSSCTCGKAGRDDDGNRLWTCESNVFVTFADGHVVRYSSSPVTITEPSDRTCTPDEVRRSDAQQ